MRRARLAICLLILSWVLVSNTRGDFSLNGNQQLTVNSYHYHGYLYDTSGVSVVSGGEVTFIQSYGSSIVDISGGSIDRNLNARNSSIVNVYSGGIYGHLYAYHSSTVNISGGYVDQPRSMDSTTLNMSGGDVRWFSAEASSIVNISGGAIDVFYAIGSPIVNISGGSIVELHATALSTINLSGQNFVCGYGLTLDGARVLGTGILSGKWLDGTPWSIDILDHSSTANIIIPEPATLLMLGLGGMILRKHRS